jgi:hypothetical protein
VKANEAGDALEGKPATLVVDARTRVRWQGVGTLTGPNAGDRLDVLAVQCQATPTTLTAWKVDARGPRPAGTSKGEQKPEQHK